MCGRASTTFTDEELAIRYLNRRPLTLPDLRPNYNLAPTQKTVVLRSLNRERQFDWMRFGLIPSWAKDIKSADRYRLINAREEEIAEKRSYKAPFQKRRCIVPVSSFFEWKRGKEGKKRPFCIRLKNDPILSLAGIWEEWKSSELPEGLFSFAIITTRANEFMATIHDRMPVILNREDEAEWLDPSNSDTASLQGLLKPITSDKLEAYEVSTLVNSPVHNGPEVLNPV